MMLGRGFLALNTDMTEKQNRNRNSKKRNNDCVKDVNAKVVIANVHRISPKILNIDNGHLFVC